MRDPDEPVSYGQKYGAKRLIEIEVAQAIRDGREPNIPQHLLDLASAPLKMDERCVHER